MDFSSYTNKNIKEVLKTLKSRIEGLNEKEVNELLKIFGSNEIKEKEVGSLEILMRQIKSPFFYLLCIASILGFLIGEITESLMILIFLLINLSLGFYQESRAEKAVSLLKKYLPSQARVIREKAEKIINKKDLVPGDIILFETGDIIPADTRIIKVRNFVVDESILSGESVPVPKITEALNKPVKEIFQAKNIAFAGTSVISGKAQGVVINTGRSSAIGEITKMVSGIARESVYEKRILEFSHLVLRIVVITIIFVFLANIAIKGAGSFFDYLIFSIALIVSIVPEALPLVTTFALSQGALNLAKEKVVVKRLSAVEDLGDIEVLCTDKTGTLTENKLELLDIRSAHKEKCLFYGLLSSSYVQEEIETIPNPFDSAIFQKCSLKLRKELENYKVIADVPFDPFRKISSVLVEGPHKVLTLISEGAAENILKRCSKFENSIKREKIISEIEREGRKGRRVLAVAYKKFSERNLSPKDENNLTFLGYFTFKDPLKKTAAEAVHLINKLGLKIKILTGDSFEVAGQVAREIGLISDSREVLLGETLEKLSDGEFHKAVMDYAVFARVSPETKYKIVERLEENFEVGFLGEGINDAPTLKAADVAISVPSAADVSRAVSDIVLLKKDLKIIVEGIKNGRTIFANIQKYIKTTLASNFGNFYSIAAISLIIPYLPMLPIQILLTNLLSDFPLITIASDTVSVEELKKPKAYQLHRVELLIIFLAFVSTIFDFIFFAIFYKTPAPLLRTLWLVESILTEIVLIYVVRTKKFFLNAKMPSFSLLGATFLIAVITLLLPYTNFGKNYFSFVSPPIIFVLVVIFLIVCYFFVSEVVKLVFYRYWNSTNNNKK